MAGQAAEVGLMGLLEELAQPGRDTLGGLAVQAQIPMGQAAVGVLGALV
jgi:hypothetical protein